MRLQHHKQKQLQTPPDCKRQHRPLALYCLCIHHNHAAKCVQNMNVTFIYVKRLLSCLPLLAALQSRSCCPSCQLASAVKKPCWQHVDRLCAHWQCSHQGSAARRRQVGLLKRNSHWVRFGLWQLFCFFWLHMSIRRDTVAVRLAMWYQESEQLLLFTVLAVITGGFVFPTTLVKARLWHCDHYPPSPHERAAWLSTLSSPSCSSFLSSHFGCNCSTATVGEILCDTYCILTSY